MRFRRILVLLLSVSILFTGGDAVALMIKSPVFKDGDTIPDKYTCKDRNISPPLFWEDIPDNTASFAIICEDPDAPGGMWVHWVIYNILKGTTKLAEGIPAYDEVENGAKQGMTDFGRVGYGGPAAPPGAAHRYFFRLYALDKILEVGSALTRDQLLEAMKGHILGEAEIMVKFKR